jgi:hypothetical protein
LTPKGSIEGATDQIQEIMKAREVLTELDTSFVQTTSGRKYLDKI